MQRLLGKPFKAIAQTCVIHLLRGAFRDSSWKDRKHIAKALRPIQLFGSRATGLHVMEALMGGITTTHLRTVYVTEWVFDALVEGLRDPNPRVRWWCVQLLDHSPDPRAITAVAPMLDDSVPRVRQNAAQSRVWGTPTHDALVSGG